VIPRLVAVLFASSLVLTACGDDSGGDSGDRDAVIELLEGEGESPESAACFADELSEFSLDDIEPFLSSDFEPDVEAAVDGEDQETDIATAVIEAAEACSEIAAE
jgi:hypothetical protein